MKNTRQRILETARELFNQYGVNGVTLRQISGKLEISQGNLNYHFKTREVLIEALYFELVEKMDGQMESLTRENSLLKILYQATEASMSVFYEYRFLLRDFYRILMEIDTVGTHYAELQKLRENQFMMMFQGLQGQGMIRKPVFEQEYERLYKRMQILGDNWINSSDLLLGREKVAVSYFSQLLFELIFPYLTDAGRKSWFELSWVQKPVK